MTPSQDIDQPLPDPKQEAFARHVAAGFSKRASALAAGYAESSASAVGSRLAKKVKISQRIQQLQRGVAQELVTKSALSVDRLLEEFGRIAFFDIRRAFNPDGTFKAISELDDDTAAVIASIEVQEIFRGRGAEREVVGSLRKIRLADKLEALSALGKHLGIFKEPENPEAEGGLMRELCQALLNSPVECEKCRSVPPAQNPEVQA